MRELTKMNIPKPPNLKSIINPNSHSSSAVSTTNIEVKMTIPNLPEEILLAIFTRLPAKSVGRFKCLSKLWLKNLSTSQFINSHLTRHQQENLLLISDAGSLHTIASPIKKQTVSKKLSGLPQSWRKVLGSCNGLVLVLSFGDELFLVNPLTQQQVRVPHLKLPSNMKHKSFHVNQMYGFGYDAVKDDYKILRLTTYFHNLDERAFDTFSHEDGIDTFAHVYSFKMGVWRRVPCDFPYKGLRFDSHIVAGAHQNGIIHWVTLKKVWVWDNPYELVTFHLADEAFAVIPFPAEFDKLEYHTASVLKGSVVLVTRVQIDRVVHVWMMKPHGVEESWTKFSIGTRGVRSIKVEPLCYSGETELVMLAGGSLLLSDLSNLKARKPKTMLVDGDHPSFSDGCVFLESLISPSSLTSITEDKNDGMDFANKTLEAGPSQAPPASSG